MDPPRRLQRRLLIVLAGFTLAVAAVFSFYTIVFAYELEDAFFFAQLREEATRLQEGRDASGHWGTTRDPRITLHRRADTLPDAVRTLLDAEPDRVEFAGGDGHHYHLHVLPDGEGGNAWLLYDVDDRLLVRPMRGSLLWLLTGTALLAVTLAIVAGHLVARGLTRRLSRLAHDVAALDPQRLPQHWTSAAGDDEVSVVTRGVDTLVSRLREFVARERSFTRDASHELRTPLAVIRSAGDQIARQPELGPTARLHAALIRDSTARLESTVDTLLALAREEQTDAPSQDVVLLPMLEQAIVEQSSRRDDGNLQVQVNVPASARVHAPPAVLQILLANLVGNAFAHSSTGVVSFAVEGEEFCIRNPVAVSELPEAGTEATPFQRGAGSDGFGLGLAIVHRLSARFAIPLTIETRGNEVVARLKLAGL